MPFHDLVFPRVTVLGVTTFSHNMRPYSCVSVKYRPTLLSLLPTQSPVSLWRHPQSELVGYWLFLCFSNSLSVWSCSVYTVHWTPSLVWHLAPFVVDGGTDFIPKTEAITKLLCVSGALSEAFLFSEYDLKHTLSLSLRMNSGIGLKLNPGNLLFVTLVQYPEHEVML